MAKNTILLTTFGSLGDLHPFLAIARELNRRGYHTAIGSVEPLRSFIEAAGIEFRLIRTTGIPSIDRGLMAKVLHVRTGPEFIIRQVVLPYLRTAYADTLTAAEDAALLLSHPLTLATPLAANRLGLRWASTHLAPLGLFSATDPPSISGAPWLDALRPLGPWCFRLLFHLARRRVRAWTAPVDALRRELHLSPAPDPMFAGANSPDLILGLFSALLGPKQPDWPAQTVVTGFPFYDGAAAEGGPIAALAPELEDFLHAGEPPLVFTLGTSAVMDAGAFYAQSAHAAQRLGRRAVLLIGREPANRPPHLPPGIAAFDYAPFSLLFPRAAVVVHQGGVGTTAQCMRAGVPQLVMPYSVDQPDNARRVVRLGIARTISRRRYTDRRAAEELKTLLGHSPMQRQAARIAAQIQQEDGATTACNHLERMLGTT